MLAAKLCLPDASTGSDWWDYAVEVLRELNHD